MRGSLLCILSKYTHFQDLSEDLFGKIYQLAETHGEEFPGCGKSGDAQSSSKIIQLVMGKASFGGSMVQIVSIVLYSPLWKDSYLCPRDNGL